MKPTSERELQRRARQRAMSIAEFCRDYGTGRTTAYQEIKAGRLRAVKCGKRTLVIADDAEAWLRSLPAAAEANGTSEDRGSPDAGV
jgi:excisionase family DNA binding protein